MLERSLFAAALLLAPAARALDWVSDRFEGSTAPLQATLDVAFAFRNASDKPATIRAVQTNCDCLRAGANKTTFAPGESGVVTAQFTVGDRIGRYERSIVVVSDDSPTPKRLLVQIEVAEPASVTPSVLNWSINSPNAEQTVEVRPAPGVRIDFTEAFPSNTDFNVRLETLEAGRAYRLHVSPRSTASAANAAIRAKGTAPDGRTVVVSAYANVR